MVLKGSNGCCNLSIREVNEKKHTKQKAQSNANLGISFCRNINQNKFTRTAQKYEHKRLNNIEQLILD